VVIVGDVGLNVDRAVFYRKEIDSDEQSAGRTIRRAYEAKAHYLCYVR
jgi:hypothetical protein